MTPLHRSFWLGPCLAAFMACGGGSGDGVPSASTGVPSTPTTTPTPAPTPLPAETPLPDFAQQNLEAIAAPLLKGRTWQPVKIPGLRDQVLNAHLNGVKSVWQNVSPGYANVIYDLKVDGGVITLILDLGGVVQSTDGGKTWRALSYWYPGNGVYGEFFTCDVSPADSKLVLAGGRNLARTTDGGKTWSEVYSPALPPFTIAANYGTVAGSYATYGRVRFNADGSRVFAALGALGHNLKERWGAETDMAARFPKSLVYVGDGTASAFQATPLGAFSGIRLIHPHPTNPDVVYFAFGNGDFYVTRNARASTPTFEKLAIPAGYEVIEMDCSPWTEGDVLLVLKSLTNADSGKVLLGHDTGSGLSWVEVPLVNAKGAAYTCTAVRCAKWNPKIQNQVVVGIEDRAQLLVSSDNLKSFSPIPVPTSLQHGESSFYLDAQKVAFDRKSNLAAAWSWIGGWTSTDGFKTWDDLLMSYDDANQLWGNRGVGFAECAVNVIQRPSAAYLCTNDHGLFRSNGSDHAHWKRISRNAGMPTVNGKPWASLFFPMGVSPDESCMLAFARGAAPNNPYSNNQLKLVRSSDKGETWADVTATLGLGDPFALTSDPIQILFNDDASQQWILTDEFLYFSNNGGASFQASPLPFAAGTGLCQLAYDANHKWLYLTTASGFARSSDGGASWTQLSQTFTPGLGVTGAGDLVLGLFGRLAVVPYGQIDALAAKNGFTESALTPYVKATIGDTVLEATSSMNGFQRIQCNGQVVLATVRFGDNWGNRVCGEGPLVSFDGGATFQWAMYNLPTPVIFSSSVSDTEILLGCGGGAFRWDLTQH
ncbi:MAG TPA: hypothetical protein PKL14_08140 [Holophaga sp.]|nr:hypothetical protein [Holophaga sp.]